jgi:hypothetical protein
MRTYAAQEKLLAAYGDKAVTAMVGPAGEQCLAAATIQFSDPEGLPSRSPVAVAWARSWAPRASRPSSSTARPM